MVGRYAAALVDSEGPRGGLGRGYDNVLTPLLDIAVPSFSDWCCVNFAGRPGPTSKSGTATFLKKIRQRATRKARRAAITHCSHGCLTLANSQSGRARVE